MRITPLALGLLLFAARPAPAADDDADVVVTKWLVLPEVDVVARRPLRPDAVFAKHLLDRASPAPKDGDEIVGTLGKPAKWTPRAAAKSDDPQKDGFVDGDDIGWAYASVESPVDRVAIAKLEGAAVLFVGGAGFTGDVYRLGDAGVPVALKKGANDVYVGTTRGAFRLTIVDSRDVMANGKSRAGIERFDASRKAIPDQVEGDETVLPSSAGTMLNLMTIESDSLGSSGPESTMVPLGVRRCSSVTGFGQETTPLRGNVVKPTDVRRRTFVSDIDGSVQSYALVPPAPSDIDKSKIGLVLSLHGAGVECVDQATAYAPKPDFWIVCPTNRGRFGFDWQDWGRLDAYEVLADALKVTDVAQRRVYLTGHSMGGHGTWHLAANDPGRFAAIAPSAGWSSFENLNGPQTTPLAWMWRAADGASQTLDLASNLAQIPTYVLHGVDDDNIPASQAHLMIDAIEKAGGHPKSHFEAGAGHWWDKDEKTPGADCVDWPGIWETFRAADVNRCDSFSESITLPTAVFNQKFLWRSITIEQRADYGRPSRVSVAWVSREAVTISTENVQQFSWCPPTPFFGPPPKFVIDGQRHSGKRHRFLRNARGSWEPVAASTERAEKYPDASGPFKQAFTNRFVLVYGTAGDEAETRELLEKARYDSEVWAYRANGDANLMSDAQFLAGDFANRNVIVYGNADTNKAWSAVFDDDCPIVAKRGAMTVGGTKHEGVVAAAFVRPRKGSDVALAAAFADTGAAATRLFYSFPVFGSGFGIPDYVVFGPGFLKEMDGDVRAAGWFDYAWRLR